MKNQLESLWEQELDAALRKLPVQLAPPTLAPRVMAAIEARQQRAWWRKPCWGWPWPIQMIAMTSLLSGLSGLAWWGKTSGLSEWLSLSPHWMLRCGGDIISLGRGFISLVEAGNLVLSTMFRPWLWVVMGVCFLMYLSCLCLGTLLVRIAYRRL